MKEEQDLTYPYLPDMQLFLFKIYQKPDPQKTIGVSLKHKILLQTEGNPTSQGRPVEQGWKLAFEQFTR